MTNTSRTLVGICLMLGLLWAGSKVSSPTLTPSASPVQTTSQPLPRRLFTIPYGSRPHQINLFPHEVEDETRPPAEGDIYEDDFPPCGGPTDFRVSWDGQRFYLTDAMVLREGDEYDGLEYEDYQVVVKVFDRRGRLVRQLVSEMGVGLSLESKRFTGLTAVAPDGKVFLLFQRRGIERVESPSVSLGQGGQSGSGGRGGLETSEEFRRAEPVWVYEVEVLNSDGTVDRELSSRLSGALQRFVSQCERGIGLDYGHMETDVEGNLYLTFSCVSSERREYKMIRIERSGRLTVMPDLGILARHTGQIWTMIGEGELVQLEKIVYMGDEEIRVDFAAYAPSRVVVYNREGQEERSFQVPASGVLSELERSLGFSSWLPSKIDGRGHLDRAAETREARWEAVWEGREVGDPYFDVLTGFVILEYDAQGNFVGERARVKEPSFGESLMSIRYERPHQVYDVDRAGNLYYLEFRRDGIEVWVSPPR